MTTPKACLCGHGLDAHEHFHRGSTCALCLDRCVHYRPGGRVSALIEELQRSLSGHHEAPAPARATPTERPHLYLVR